MEPAILGIYFISLCILFAFGIHALVLLYYYHKTEKLVVPDKTLSGPFPLVTVQLPLFNELYVIERLIRTVCEFDYPKDKLEIQVLDDSTDETIQLTERLVKEYKEKGFDIVLIHRTDRSGYKAGALKSALEVAKGEFIAIFDADFVPNKDFLLKTLAHFEDPQIGLVQTRWEHLNEDFSFLTKVQALALDGHFVIEQQVRNKAGFFMQFNGTGGVWRKETIYDSGNWQADTLAEDMDLSYRAQLRGWRFVFLNNVTSPAELPADINGLKTQQFRWTKGAIETAIKSLPNIFRSKLPWKVKAECFVQLSSNIIFPFILLVALLNVPLVFIKNTVIGYDGVFTFMSVFVLASIATFLFYMYAQKAIHLDWRRRLLLFPVFLAGSMGLAVNNTKAVFEALRGKKTEFARTPKYIIKDADDKHKNKKYIQKKLGGGVILELALTLYFVVGIVASIYYLEIAAIPFQLMFLGGFGSVGILSLRHAMGR